MKTNPSLFSLVIYAFKKHKLNTFLVCICLIIGSSFNIVIVKAIEGIASFIENKQNVEYIFLIPLIFSAIEHISNIVWRIYDHNYMVVSSNIKARIIKALFSNLQNKDINFFKRNVAGKNTNQIMEISRSIEELFDLITRNFLFKISEITIAIIAIYYYSSKLAFILAIWMILFLILMSYFTPYIVRFTHQFAEKRTLVASSILDSILNIHTIKNFFTQKYEKKYLSFFYHQMVRSEQKMLKIQNIFKAIIWFSYSVMIYFVLLESINLYYTDKIDIVSIPLILYIIMGIGESFSEILQDGSDILNEFGILKQSVNLIKPSDIQDNEKAQHINIEQGEIKFSNVFFKYQGHKKYLMENLSITIPAKQKVALVGYSGAGKTTFINLVNRTFEISSGSIEIDGHNINNVTQKSLNREVCFIPQDTILFNRSILENIAYGSKEYSIEQIHAAAKKAHIHDLIMQLPEEYNTLCGERGNQLSGGQKQRILIARAILLDKPILIMDEATSALDQVTERLINKSLNYLMQNKTTLVIAHKLSTIKSLDRILVFDNGQIIEDGSHDELMQKKGKYYNMYMAVLDIN